MRVDSFLSEKQRMLLTFLSDGKWADGDTLVHRFGKETVQSLFEIEAICRQYVNRDYFPGYQYKITEDGKRLI